MILGIPFIGVDFRSGDKDKSGLGRQLSDERLLDVSVRRRRILVLVGPEPVLFDSQDAARMT